MQSNTLNSTTGSGDNEGRIAQGAGSAHDAVTSAADRANAAVDSAVDKVKPIIGRVADSAHQAVDKAASLAERPAEWIAEKRDGLRDSQEQMLGDAREYILANPLKAVGIALVSGLVIGRLMR